MIDGLRYASPILRQTETFWRNHITNESDWKLFKKIKEQAIVLFCDRALAEFDDVIKDKSSGSQATYTLLYRLVLNRNKQMALIFDGQSRSRAHLQLLAMRGEGLANEELLKQLSNEFLRQTDPGRVKEPLINSGSVSDG